MHLALVKSAPEAPEESDHLSYLKKLRLLAVEERRKMIRLVENFDDPIEQGRAELAEILKQSGGKEPVQVGMDSVEDLMQVGESVQPYFNALIQSIANATDGQTVFPKLKNRERILEKMNGEYKESGFGSVRDVVRASIVFEDLKNLYRAVEHLYGSAEIVFVEDRFLNPTASGYSDMKLYIRLPSPDGRALITELQLHIPEMLKAKKLETELYVKRRSLETQLSQLEKDVEPQIRTDLEAQIAAYRAQGEEIYQEAAQEYYSKFSD